MVYTLFEKTKPIFKGVKWTYGQLIQGDTRNILNWTLGENKPNQTQFMLAPSIAGGQETKLKKQSQFVPGLMSVTSYVKGDYDNMPVAGNDENKAKQSQSYAAEGNKGAKQTSEV